MTEQHYNWWLAAHFTESEAKELAYNAADPEKTYFSHPATAARSQRIKWVDELKQKGWTIPQIMASINNYYTQEGKASPWDFIRENYRSIGTVKIADYRQAAAQRAKERTEKLYSRT